MAEDQRRRARERERQRITMKRIPITGGSRSTHGIQSTRSNIGPSGSGIRRSSPSTETRIQTERSPRAVNRDTDTPVLLGWDHLLSSPDEIKRMTEARNAHAARGKQRTAAQIVSTVFSTRPEDIAFRKSRAGRNNHLSITM